MTTFHPDPRRWWALVLIAVAQFLVIMDTSIIGVALPEIQEALGFSQAQLSWVFNAYVIAFGGLLLLGGRLSDIHGPRRIFALGFAILGGASLLRASPDHPSPAPGPGAPGRWLGAHRACRADAPDDALRP